MATKQATTNVSIRRNRDYSTTFLWTQELNQDVYNFYLLTRQDPRKGYMKRLKDLWDKKYPMHNHLSEKHLRQQAVFIENKRQNQLEVIEDLNSDISGIQSSDNEANNVSIADVTDSDVNIQSQVLDFSSQFEKHFNETFSKTLSERKYSTNVIGSISNDILIAINNVILEHIRDKASLTYWDINCIQYAAAITVLEHQSKLKDCTINNNRNVKKPWVINAENQINAIRRKISYIELVLNNTNVDNYTKKQLTVRSKVKRMCGTLKASSLNSKLSTLKHDLKVCNLKLKDGILKADRSRINYLFTTNQKVVYRNWKGKQIEVKNKPSLDEIKSFWTDIWGKETPINLESEWYRDLKGSYCQNVNTKSYSITMDILEKFIAKLPNKKAPGADKITGIWIKKLTPLHSHLFSLLYNSLKGDTEIPDWLAGSNTILLPKTIETHLAKNYRPIACLNTTYKLYTSILNHFIEDHCITNDIITVEQAGGKKGLWGCADQLLINKMVLDEVHKNRRNLFTMWFDYKKAFDSVPHQWLFEAMKLAKLPTELINAIHSLIQKWTVKVQLKTNDSITVTDAIKYLTGILQGDCLSLLLFVICVNPLSYLLKKNCNGYMIGKTGNRTSKINHLLFVDDLKTYAMNRTDAEAQLRLITQFSKDIGMKFGADKCAYLYIERGQRKSLGKAISINGLELEELEVDDSYKYLGLDEDVAIKGDLNKERVTKEYYNRVRKIWRSELYAKNKVQAHNVFAVPVLTGTFGVIDWTKDEISAIDIKTRKILTCTGNFHRNSNVDRLYTERDQGGRGLSSIFDVFVTRLMSLVEHLTNVADTHEYLHLVVQHEEDRLFRVSQELTRSLQIDEATNNQKIAARAKKTIKANHKKAWDDKRQHGFVFKKQQDVKDHNTTLTNSWLKLQGIISHTEGYICAIQEQEIRTRALDAKRMHPDDNNFISTCRYCKQHKEDIFHILCSCECLSASLYLPVRHNEVARVLYNAIIQLNETDHPNVLPCPAWSNSDLEIWWDLHIKTVPAVKNNKPDIVVWHKKEKDCTIIDVCVPLDENVHTQEKKKKDTYTPLLIGLNRMYPEYTYKVVPIVLGATGLITNSLVDNLLELKFDKSTAMQLIPKLQRKALIGSMRVVKGAMSMKK